MLDHQLLSRDCTHHDVNIHFMHVDVVPARVPFITSAASDRPTDPSHSANNTHGPAQLVLFTRPGCLAFE